MSPERTPRPDKRATTNASRRSSSRRRRITFAVLCVLTVPLLLIAVQGYRILDAIGEAQGAAVVPLPTRSARTSGTAGHRFAPTPTDPVGAAAAEPTPAPAATEDANRPTPVTDDGTSGPAGTAPPPTPTAPSPPTPAAALPAEPATTSVGETVQTDDGDTSALEVLQQLAIAGTSHSDPGQDDVWQGRESITILVLGVDRRASGGDQNADVIIIARLDLRTKQVLAVGIPRDLLVEIPGYGPGKINGAYNLGVKANPDDPVAGVALMRDTVEDNFGVTIDHYVLVDFEGFTDVVDAVGGVDVAVPEQIRDDNYPTEDFGTEVVVFEPGPQHMDGERALKYARTRNADNDDARRERQFQLLRALFDEGQSLGSLTRATDIILALGDAVQTSFTLPAQISLARIGLDMAESDIHLVGVGQPLVQEGWTDDGAWVYVGDPAAIAAFVQEALGVRT
jgi:LCP family protein required for cell wall assembly